MCLLLQSRISNMDVSGMDESWQKYAGIKYEGAVYPTIEHAFQVAKKR